MNASPCLFQANDHTVDIDSAQGLDSSLDSMGLTLLSTHRATDRFKADGFTTNRQELGLEPSPPLI